MCRYRPATFLKKRLQHRCFSVSIAEYLRTPFFHIIPLVAASGFRIWKEKIYIHKILNDK